MTLGLSGSDKCRLAYFVFFLRLRKALKDCKRHWCEAVLPVVGPTGRDLFRKALLSYQIFSRVQRIRNTYA